MIPKDLKDKLGYVCKTKFGYVHDLENNIGKPCIDKFALAGFITKGITLKSSTWCKTELADKYYIDMYGRLAYIFNKLF